jgi:hypothetical protein
MNMIDQYFALEPTIVEALKSSIPEIKTIHTPFNIEEMLEITNEEVALSVIYFDDRVAGSAGQGGASTIFQQWLVVLSIRDASSQLQETNAIRELAAPHIGKVLSTMNGLDPTVAGFDVFKRVNSPVRSGGKTGHFYFPMMFECLMFNV